MDYLRKAFQSSSAAHSEDLTRAIQAKTQADLRERESVEIFRSFDEEAGKIDETLTRLRDYGALLD